MQFNIETKFDLGFDYAIQQSNWQPLFASDHF